MAGGGVLCAVKIGISCLPAVFLRTGAGDKVEVLLHPPGQGSRRLTGAGCVQMVIIEEILCTVKAQLGKLFVEVQNLDSVGRGVFMQGLELAGAFLGIAKGGQQQGELRA